MANNKQRYVNTRFWNDNYVSQLDPIEKLLFLYLLTNEHTNISGVYELPYKIMAVETGIDASMFKKILPRIQDKIRYVNGYVVIKNFIKHQETGSPNVRTGILNCLRDLDAKFLENIVNKGYIILPQYCIDTLHIPYMEGRNYLDSNLDSNLDLDSDSDGTKVPTEQVGEEELPEWLNKEVWAEWWKYRKTRRVSTTEITKKKQLKLLEENKETHVQMLEASMTNGWTGLFPVRKNYSKPLTPDVPYKPGKYANIKKTVIQN